MMRHFLAISLAALSLAACADGYYDANGNHVVPPVGSAQTRPAPLVENQQIRQTTVESYSADGDIHPMITQTTKVTTYYDEPFGDHNRVANYNYQPAGPNVPPAMEPPAGSCRFWYPDRPLDAQLPLESCDNIRSRTPAGAYVIFGG